MLTPLTPVQTPSCAQACMSNCPGGISECWPQRHLTSSCPTLNSVFPPHYCPSHTAHMAYLSYPSSCTVVIGNVPRPYQVQDPFYIFLVALPPFFILADSLVQAFTFPLLNHCKCCTPRLCSIQPLEESALQTVWSHDIPAYHLSTALLPLRWHLRSLGWTYKTWHNPMPRSGQIELFAVPDHVSLAHAFLSLDVLFPLHGSCLSIFSATGRLKGSSSGSSQTLQVNATEWGQWQRWGAGKFLPTGDSLNPLRVRILGTEFRILCVLHTKQHAQHSVTA